MRKWSGQKTKYIHIYNTWTCACSQTQINIAYRSDDGFIAPAMALPHHGTISLEFIEMFLFGDFFSVRKIDPEAIDGFVLWSW